MTIDMCFSRRSLIIVGAALPWLALPADTTPPAPAITLSHLPAYAREAANALHALTETEQTMLSGLAGRCLAALPADDPAAAVAALDKLAQEDFIAGRTLFAGGWLISLSEAAVLSRLAPLPDETTASEGAG